MLVDTLVKSGVVCTYSSGLRRSMWLRSRGVGDGSTAVTTKAVRAKEPAQRGCREGRAPRGETRRAGGEGGGRRAKQQAVGSATGAGGRERLEKWR